MNSRPLGLRGSNAEVYLLFQGIEVVVDEKERLVSLRTLWGKAAEVLAPDDSVVDTP